ncbi:MAG: hypothetical protein ABGX00_13295 [Allomuricauda sp.]
MPFDSRSGAVAGRKSTRKGISNERSKKLKEKVDTLLEDNWEKFMEDLEQLEPKERMSLMIKLLDFVVPRLSRAHVEQDVKRVTIDMSEWGK